MPGGGPEQVRREAAKDETRKSMGRRRHLEYTVRDGLPGHRLEEEQTVEASGVLLGNVE